MESNYLHINIWKSLLKVNRGATLHLQTLITGGNPYLIFIICIFWHPFYSSLSWRLNWVIACALCPVCDVRHALILYFHFLLENPMTDSSTNLAGSIHPQGNRISIYANGHLLKKKLFMKFSGGEAVLYIDPSVFNLFKVFFFVCVCVCVCFAFVLRII